METHDVALQTQIPVQNTRKKKDILIVTQNCHSDTTAGKITLVEDGERRLQNIVIQRFSKDFEGRISKAAACACVGNTRDKCTELSQQRARMRT